MSAINRPPKSREATRLIRTGAGRTPVARTVGPAIQRGSTVLMDRAEALYDESRPTYGMNALVSHDALREALCELEGANAAELFSSGLAACAGAVAAVCDSGSQVLAADNVYGPTRRFLNGAMARFGVSTRYFPAAAAPGDIAALIGPRTRLIVLESPGSLTFEMQDVPAIARLARERGILTMVDNTWAAGVLFRPLEHGVHLSVQALTKYVCGHSDVFLGSAATRDPEVAARLADFVRETGASTPPDDAAAALRGLRTLSVRLERHGRSALQVARWLERRPEVRRVLYPALESDPFHALWKRDFVGACGLFGVRLDGPQAAARAFLDALELFGLGFSWGGYESLAINADPQMKRTAMAPPSADDAGALVRLHIGLEDPLDLIEDLERGFCAFRRHIGAP